MTLVHPGLSRLTPPQEQTPEGPDIERSKAYQLFRVRLDYDNGNNARSADRIIHTSGDHLTVLEIQGADQVAIRTDRSTNPFVPVREGDRISRRFDSVTLRPMSLDLFAPGTLGIDPDLGGSMIAGFAEVLILVSWGPMLTRPFKEYGFRRGFFAGKGSATQTGVDIFATIAALHGFSDRAGWPLIGRFGGTFVFKNMDPAADIYIGMGFANNMKPPADPHPWPGADTCWIVSPGETLKMRLESLMSNVRKSPYPNALTLYGNLSLIAMTDFAGTAPFRAMVSSGPVDGADAESGGTVQRIGYD